MAALAVCIALTHVLRVLSCSDFLVSKGASAEGTVMFSYSADSGSLYGTLGHYPAADHPENASRQIYDWDSGIYRGQIPEVRHTYNVVGNVNEHGLAIGETTFGGNDTLAGGEGIIDYGSLIWIALQRSQNAREAISVMTSLVAKYGYVSEGESFTIADSEELWILELIGKGKFGKGAVWVAVRIPNGYVSGHANQARIRTFPLHDPENCIYAHDVVEFAVKLGLYPPNAPHEDFSFSDTYDPMTFYGARNSDARVWSFFSKVGPEGFEQEYLDYATGKNLTHRMPLYIKPRNLVTLQELFEASRSHYEGMALDDRKDVGAGPYHASFRGRPLHWQYKGKAYINERKPGTEQTGWNFVAQIRSGVPAPLAAVNWFGVDDTSFSVRVPFFGATTRVPRSFADGNGDALSFSFDSAFWVNNMVANFAYQNAYAVPEILQELEARERQHFEAFHAADVEARSLFEQSPDRAIEFVTKFSEDLANAQTQYWLGLWQRLFVQYRDGFNITSAGPRAPNHGGKQGGIVPSVRERGYDEEWKGRIVQDTGSRYEVPESQRATPSHNSKLRVLSKGTIVGIETDRPLKDAQVSGENFLV